MKDIYQYDSIVDFAEDLIPQPLHQNYLRILLLNHLIYDYDLLSSDEIIGRKIRNLKLNQNQKRYITLLIEQFNCPEDDFEDKRDELNRYRHSLQELNDFDRALFESNSVFKTAVNALKRFSIGDDINDWKYLLKQLTPIFSLEMAFELKGLLTRLGIIAKNKHGYYKPVEQLQ